MSEKGFCTRCKKSMNLETNFYKVRDGSRIDLCKKCIGAHIDNSNPETFLWVLKKLDVPYVKSIWEDVLVKAINKDPSKIAGNAVLGKYLAKMRIQQWKDYGWDDNERIQQTIEKQQSAAENQKDVEQEIKKEILQEQLDKGEITQTEYDLYLGENAELQIQKAKEKMVEEIKKNTFDIISGKDEDNPYDEREFIDEDILPDPSAELTDEDKKYLALKWGTLYRPKEWVSLEQHYTEMCNSFPVEDADTKSTLKILCKTYLKMNQALDAGDVSSYKHLAGVYDSLRKSAKFMANQRKEEKAGYFNSVGELVLLCEKEGGFIPRYCTDVPQDNIDVAVKDTKEYLYNLITRELGFGQQIEDAIKRIEIQNELEKEESFDDESDLGLSDEELIEYYDDINNQKEKDRGVTAIDGVK